MNPDLIKYIYEEQHFHSYKKVVTAVLWNDYHVTVEIPYEWIDKDFATGDTGLSIGKAVYDAVKDVVLNQLTDELYKKIKANPILPKKKLFKHTEGELLSPEQLEKKMITKAGLFAQLYGSGPAVDKKAADMFAEAYKDSQLDDSTIVKPTIKNKAEALTNMVQQGVISPKQMMDYINAFKDLDAKKSPSYKPPGSNPKPQQKPSIKPKIWDPKPKSSGLSSNVVTKLAKFIPALTEFMVDDCPACREALTNGTVDDWPYNHPQKGLPHGSVFAPQKLSDMIILLNDTHDWEREGKTSEWLESLPCDITFREPGPKGPLADLPPVEAFDPGQFPPF